MRTVRYSSSFSGTRASSRRRRGSIMSRLFGAYRRAGRRTAPGEVVALSNVRPGS
jgi:hypothetical protein